MVAVVGGVVAWAASGSTAQPTAAAARRSAGAACTLHHLPYHHGMNGGSSGRTWGRDPRVMIPQCHGDCCVWDCRTMTPGCGGGRVASDCAGAGERRRSPCWVGAPSSSGMWTGSDSPCSHQRLLCRHWPRTLNGCRRRWTSGRTNQQKGVCACPRPSLLLPLSCTPHCGQHSEVGWPADGSLTGCCLVSRFRPPA